KGFQLAAKCFQLAAKCSQLVAKCSQKMAGGSQKMAGASQKTAKCFQKAAKCSQKMIFWMPKMARFDHPSAGLLWTDAFPPLSASGEPSGSPPASNQNQTRQNQDSQTMNPTPKLDLNSRTDVQVVDFANLISTKMTENAGLFSSPNPPLGVLVSSGGETSPATWPTA